MHAVGFEPAEQVLRGPVVGPSKLQIAVHRHLDDGAKRLMIVSRAYACAETQYYTMMVQSHLKLSQAGGMRIIAIGIARAHTFDNKHPIMFRRRSILARWAAFNLIGLLVVMHLTITTVRSSMDEEPEAEDRAEHEERHFWTKCTKWVKHKCCRLKPRTTREGLIRLYKAPCPDKLIMKCCPGLKAMIKTRQDGGPDDGTDAKTPLGPLNLGDILVCVEDLINNLLQLKISLVGDNRKDQGGCCSVPIIRNACPVSS